MLSKIIVGYKPGPTNSSEYDIMYTSVFNNFSSAVPAGGHVCIDTGVTSGSTLGFAVTQPATANLMLYVGCCPVSIPTKTWGLAVCYGIVENALLDGGTTDGSIGSAYVVANGTFTANAPAAATQGQGWITALVAQTNTSAATRALIRAM